MSYLDDLFSLTGKTAIVTGASRGLGRAMSVALAKAGANVVLVGRDFTALHDTSEAIAAKKQTHIVQGDITSSDIIAKTLNEAQEQFGGIDILVNNAGVIRRGGVLEYALKDWEEVIETNLKGVFLWSQAVCKLMKEKRSGKIINVASLLSFTGGINAVAYAASKGGVGQMTKAFANELAPHGVNVNAVAPGYFVTDATAALRANPERSTQVFSRIPAGRWGNPEDLSGAVVFLASKASDYVNGHILAVDGGYLAY
jgi:2-dehydro-3-deoxy-D-gluconate 5-dehydrogenase